MKKDELKARLLAEAEKAIDCRSFHDFPRFDRFTPSRYPSNGMTLWRTQIVSGKPN